jgi:hypothetical protein
MLAISLPSSAFLWVVGMGVAVQPRPPAFLEREKVEAFEWLAGHGVSWSVVLTGLRTGTALPAFAPMRVVVGHGVESIGLEENLRRAEDFYQGKMSEVEQRKFLEANHVLYVFYGTEESRNAARDLNARPFLEQIYDAEGYQIYAVTDAP